MPLTIDQRRQLAAVTRNLLRKALDADRANARRSLVSLAAPADTRAAKLAEAERQAQHADHLLDAATYEFVGELEDLFDHQTAGGPPAVAAGEGAPGLTDGGAGTSAGPTVRGLTGYNGARFA